ncbi:MAG: serine hydrolase [Verrucomicrobiales bacterium]|nr:serine hydrolase [Verrucomicrobiales bacterium]
MTSLRILVCLSFLCCSTAPVAGRDGELPFLASSKVTVPVNAAVEGLIEQEMLAGAVTLVAARGGKVIHLQAHGIHRIDRETPKMTSDRIFRIFSMTKAVTSAAALQLLEKGKYKLTDPVADFIPSFANLQVRTAPGESAPAKKTMTVEDLFRHTSGLAYNFTAPPDLVPAYNGNFWGGTLEDFCDQVAAIPLVHEPGEGWTYGVSTDVLGRLVEIWSGESLDDYLQTEFFDPLKMKNTGFYIREEMHPGRSAAMHYSTDSGLRVGEDPDGNSYRVKPTAPSGGGGLFSTASDYYQFLQMIADGGSRHGHTFLKPGTVAMMTSNRLPESIPNIHFGNEQRNGVGFGLGFSVVIGETKGWDDDAKPGEYGWGGAASTHYWVSPHDDNLIVITMEQTMPYNWNLERALKPVIYEFLRNADH